jgi:hypothetical protein
VIVSRKTDFSRKVEINNKIEEANLFVATRELISEAPSGHNHTSPSESKVDRVVKLTNNVEVKR